MKNKENKEHLDPMSYSWCILRLAFIKMFVKHIQNFINISGIELQGTSNYIIYFLSFVSYIYIFNRFTSIKSPFTRSIKNFE